MSKPLSPQVQVQHSSAKRLPRARPGLSPILTPATLPGPHASLVRPPTHLSTETTDVCPLHILVPSPCPPVPIIHVSFCPGVRGVEAHFFSSVSQASPKGIIFVRQVGEGERRKKKGTEFGLRQTQEERRIPINSQSRQVRRKRTCYCPSGESHRRQQ